MDPTSTTQTVAEERVSDGETRYREIVESAYVGVWRIDNALVTEYANPRMAEMLGYAGEEMVGRHLFDFMDAEDASLAQESLQRQAAGTKERISAHFRCKDGSDIWTMLSVSPFFDEAGESTGNLAIVTDVTEHVGAAGSRQQAEERFRMPPERTPIGMPEEGNQTPRPVALRALRAVLVLMAVIVVAGSFTGGGELIRVAALVTAAAVTFARVILVKEERLLWTVWGVGLLAWTGQLYYIVIPTAAVTFPAVPDYMALIFYGSAMAGVVLFVKARLHGRRKSLWLDGVIGGLALSALMSLFVFRAALAGSGVGSRIVNGQLGYAISDLFMLGFLSVVALLGGWRVGFAKRAFIAGFALLALGDSLYVSAVADNQLAPTELVSSLWALGPLTLAAAATHRRRVVQSAHAMGLVPVVLLGVSGMSSLCLLLAYAFGLVGQTPALIALAAAVLGVTVVRFCASLLENNRILETSQVQALTDSLTGLRNRRRLMSDLENAIRHASAREPLMLGLFDLDGFKSYNDTFGHPAGDQLLVRLGKKLTGAVAGHGTAYRMGGDEFCVLVHGAPDDAEGVLAAARLSLAERGQHFSVAASCGSAWIPGDARDANAALHLADQRMYGAKDRRPCSARRQSRDVLLKALHERQPELREHGRGVTDLAVAVALRAGMEGEQLDELTRAAELHDIGKIAIPQAILEKPGPLNDEEWEFMRRHPLLGERILGVAPALTPIAKLVRSSHERWDGNGYPDRLEGDQIPMGSRIIFVCDAFDAMTEERPYRATMTSQEAIAELQKCAGSQFDPRAVALLCQVLEGRTESRTDTRGNDRVDGPIPIAAR